MRSIPELDDRVTRLERQARDMYGQHQATPMPGALQINSKIIGSTAVGCRLRRQAALVVGSGVLTPIPFDETRAITDDNWSAGDPTKIYARRAGYYVAGGGWVLMSTDNTVASRLHVAIRHNGGEFVDHNEVHTIPGKDVAVAVATGIFYMNPGDYIEVLIYHDQGGNRTAPASPWDQNYMTGWLVRIP